MTKVLYVDHPEADYGSGFLYNGLCRVLGPENVHDYPIKWSLHGRDHRYSTRDIADGFTSPYPWMPSYPVSWTDEEQADPTRLLEEVRRRLVEGYYPLVVMGSMRSAAMDAGLSLLPYVRRGGAKLVVHEGEDFQEYCGRHLSELKPDLHLKREVSKRRAFSCDWPVLPFPFSFPDTPRTEALLAPGSDASEERGALDVVFMAGGTWGFRFDVLRGLSGMAAAEGLRTRLGTDRREKFAGDPNVGDLAGWWEYLGLLARSRCGVSVRGYGYDTCRFWETAYSTLVVTDRLDLVVPEGYTDGVDCVEFDSVDTLQQKLRDILSPGRREDYLAMNAACGARTRRHHTNSARARQMLERVGVPY